MKNFLKVLPLGLLLVAFFAACSAATPTAPTASHATDIPTLQSPTSTPTNEPPAQVNPPQTGESRVVAHENDVVILFLNCKGQNYPQQYQIGWITDQRYSINGLVWPAVQKVVGLSPCGAQEYARTAVEKEGEFNVLVFYQFAPKPAVPNVDVSFETTTPQAALKVTPTPKANEFVRTKGTGGAIQIKATCGSEITTFEYLVTDVQQSNATVVVRHLTSNGAIQVATQILGMTTVSMEGNDKCGKFEAGYMQLNQYVQFHIFRTLRRTN